MREPRAHILLPGIFPGAVLCGSMARAMQKRPPGGKTMRTVKALALVVTVMSALVTLSALTGCVRVAPYERGTHPSMTADDMSSGMDEHVRAVSEGATGGFGGGGGGCGCN
jgi:hypothetical protein